MELVIQLKDSSDLAFFEPLLKRLKLPFEKRKPENGLSGNSSFISKSPQDLASKLEANPLFLLLENATQEERNELLEHLKMLVFEENWAKLTTEIPSANFSDEEIMAEIKAERRVRSLKKQSANG